MPRGPRRGDDLPNDPDLRDGYPPQFETTPDERSIAVDSFETTTVEGIEVPLAPIDVAYYWYARGEARFADARGSGQYERSHVYGAVLSPALSDIPDDPVVTWPVEDRVICYCGCPHHLSSIRASQLREAGHKAVYVIDEGYGEWFDREYPIAGSTVESRPDPWVIDGMVDQQFAGQYVIARHLPTEQAEAAPIADDGSFRLELRFAAVTADATIVVDTPDSRIIDRLGGLATGSLTERL